MGLTKVIKILSLEKIFLTWTIRKSLLNLLQYCFCCLCFDFSAERQTRIRDGTHAPSTGKLTLNQWTASEVLINQRLESSLSLRLALKTSTAALT